MTMQNKTISPTIPKPMSESYSRALFELMATYIKKDLRRRFDESHDWTEAINIIDETNSFGFTALADEMISDFKTDPECESLWNLHRDFIERETREGNDPTERQAKSFVHSENGHEL